MEIIDFMSQVLSDPSLSAYARALAALLIMLILSCIMLFAGISHYSQLEYEMPDRDDEELYLTHKFSDTGALKFRNGRCVFFNNGAAVSRELTDIDSIEFGGTDDDRVITVRTGDGASEDIHCGRMTGREFLKIHDLMTEYAGHG